LLHLLHLLQKNQYNHIFSGKLFVCFCMIKKDIVGYISFFGVTSVTRQKNRLKREENQRVQPLQKGVKNGVTRCNKKCNRVGRGVVFGDFAGGGGTQARKEALQSSSVIRCQDPPPGDPLPGSGAAAWKWTGMDRNGLQRLRRGTGKIFAGGKV